MARDTLANLLKRGASVVEGILGSGKNQDGTDYTLPVEMSSAPLPADAATAARQDTGNASLATLAAQTAAATATLSNVVSAAADTPLLAANAARKGALVFNDADKALYLKFGAAATTTSFTVKIAAGGYYELPAPVFTGQINGIWEAAPTGSARLTELT